MKFTKPTAATSKAFSALTLEETTNAGKAKTAKMKAWQLVAASLGMEVHKEPPSGADQLVIKDEAQLKVLDTAKEYWAPLYSGAEGGFSFWWSRCMNQGLGMRFKAYSPRGTKTPSKGEPSTGAPDGFKLVAADAATFTTVEAGFEVLAEALGDELTADESRYMADHFIDWLKSIRESSKPASKPAKLARR